MLPLQVQMLPAPELKTVPVISLAIENLKIEAPYLELPMRVTCGLEPWTWSLGAYVSPGLGSLLSHQPYAILKARGPYEHF